jgi:hypothetical protein
MDNKAPKQKDFGNYTVLLILIVLALLLAISFVPSFEGYKHADILKDIRIEKNVVIKKPYWATKKKHKQKIHSVKKHEIEIPDGVVELEDYSANKAYLQPVMERLKSIATSEEPVRIGFYGDSFTECEIITGDFRQALQSTFGGEGGGFVPLRIESAGPSPLVDLFQSDVESYSIIAKKKGNLDFQGLSGRYFLAHNNAVVALTCKAYKPKTRYAQTAHLYFCPLKPVDIICNRNGKWVDTLHYERAKCVQQLEIKGGIYSLNFRFVNTDSVVLYGVGLDCDRGVQLDNLSLRGNSGISLYAIPTHRLREFNAHRPYDLVFLQYGLNAFSPATNFEGYKKKMIGVVNRLKGCFPKARFVLVGMSDKGEMVDGEVVTCQGIYAFIEAQRQVAESTGICFWNMFQAMGGEGTIARWAEGEHPLAAKDFTHISPAAGRIIARKLTASFLLEYEKYK